MSAFDDVANVIRTYFGQPDLKLTPESTAADVRGWDSLAHASLMIEIEKHFDIEFDLEEIMGFENVGEMAATVAKYQATGG